MQSMSDKKRRPVLCAGVRTAFAKYGTGFAQVQTHDLGAHVVNDLLAAYPVLKDHVQEVVFGCVAQNSMAPNIARVIQLKTPLGQNIPALTVSRNCASGFEVVAQAMNQILLGRGDLFIVGGVESMSNSITRLPLTFNEKMAQLSRAKTITEKLKTLVRFRPNDIKPINTLNEGLTDPVEQLIMGLTAEILAREFEVSREEQDEFAVASHQKAAKAWRDGFFEGEVRPVTNGVTGSVIAQDNGIRANASVDKLNRLSPFFQTFGGTVTVANSSQVTDGAVGIVVASEAKAEALGLPVLAYLRDYAFAGCDPKRMGLGPVFAGQKLLRQHNKRWDHMDAVEINEAFAAQVLSCLKLMSTHAHTDGMPDTDTLNPNGGAIAMGHPVGASGARLVLTMSRYLKKNGLKDGMVTLCVGGGQGGAVWIESA